MAHYNFPLRMLRMVKDAAREGRAIMPVERAIQRLTAEIGDGLGIDAGRLEVGGRADVVVRPTPRRRPTRGGSQNILLCDPTLLKTDAGYR
ncbi:hypothetical protein BE17_28390 [Sorangium cellulosum]|uniref:Uncharacterized protein n=1 Tax=Sorangium cellulosum TaxID=56 RepID=A0A150RAX0_SORCE|nr:hypothetical protein BE17_28390 [Sorangium cellulosum]